MPESNDRNQEKSLNVESKCNRRCMSKNNLRLWLHHKYLYIKETLNFAPKITAQKIYKYVNIQSVFQPFIVDFWVETITKILVATKQFVMDQRVRLTWLFIIIIQIVPKDTDWYGPLKLAKRFHFSWISNRKALTPYFLWWPSLPISTNMFQLPSELP